MPLNLYESFHLTAVSRHNITKYRQQCILLVYLLVMKIRSNHICWLIFINGFCWCRIFHNYSSQKNQKSDNCNSVWKKIASQTANKEIAGSPTNNINKKYNKHYKF